MNWQHIAASGRGDTRPTNRLPPPVAGVRFEYRFELQLPESRPRLITPHPHDTPGADAGDRIGCDLNFTKTRYTKEAGA